MEYKVSNNVVYSCKYRVVWCPKYRRKVLTEPIDSRLKEVLISQAKVLNVEICEMEITSNCVYLLIDVPPQVGINKAVRSLKGQSSRILRREYPSLKSRLPTLWTQSFFVSSVGGDASGAIAQYIENQNANSRSGEVQKEITTSE